MNQIGLYGGSFDPIHLGHLLVAQAAYEELQLDKLVFIPAARSPFKPDSEPLEAHQRLRLIRLALAGRTEFDVYESEIQSGGVSFTIDTVRRFITRYPSARFIYLIGTDHIATLPQWKEAAALSELVEFAVIPRLGEQMVDSPVGFRCRFLRGFPIELSSSAIRDRIRAGRSIDLMVPAAVAEVIYHYRLYSSN
ncbi:MAG: putative nicotinate-nucleotide adenylyltransferase [Verrucomicrobia subdivision 3 bacterium]|nr:putative nicotinate-nucleotide adenylyltransferase [Limisphaerales bacterium]MCS1417723.1 putative nicotinate-nucleotide adenylyltransferase [Limisphaerales bacterium]